MQCTRETGLACPLTDVNFLILAKTCLRKAGLPIRRGGQAQRWIIKN